MIEPILGLKIVIWGGWALIILGAAKMILWIVGEVFPNAYKNLKSETTRKFMTGTGNSLLFGLGGFVTALLGWGFAALGHWLLSRFVEGPL